MNRPASPPLPRRLLPPALAPAFLTLALLTPAAAGADLAAELRTLDAGAISAEEREAHPPDRMLVRDVHARLRDAGLRENKAWHTVKTRADWEKYRDARLRALRASLGRFPSPPKTLKVRVTREWEGDGFRVENLVYESRPGVVVTANLYRPAKPAKSMPGILIAHSHHNPKEQGELQDMGMTWARQGCLVLVPEHIGHGERRQHPFRTTKDYPHPFRLGRQDYYFRYNTGVQLTLAGESLMGWMVWDLMRGVDLLLSRPGVDKERILLLGAVAGGGDPAAVTAALDPRVQAVVPFNFGGAQPDYAIPTDAERNFYYFGVPDWESTRCLRLGARDGFAQWLIVAAVAPRRVVNAHEFAWDQARDPVWPRMQQVFAWYDAADHLTFTTGRGSVRGKPPESTHCNNIGAFHRSKLYPALERWFGMPVPKEYSRRRPTDQLRCLTPEAVREFRPRPVHALAAELADRQLVAVRKRRAELSAADRRKRLRRDWARVLGDVKPGAAPRVLRHNKEKRAGVTVERLTLRVGPTVVVPLVILTPPTKAGMRLPVVVGVAQGGKEGFLRRRSAEIAALLGGGVAVCLPDVRGTGETRPAGASRRHRGADTSLSVSEGLLGQTLVGSRLRDLRSVLGYLRGRADLDAARIALWGDSFAPANAADANLAVPLDATDFPHQAEPLGGLLALLGALFEEDVHAVAVRGGLAGYRSLLQSPFVYVPHDALVPDVFTAGDLGDLAATLAPRALRLEGLVDGLNRTVPAAGVARTYEPARAAYRAAAATARLDLGGEGTAVRWLLGRLGAK